jgi:hypothetical protein
MQVDLEFVTLLLPQLDLQLLSTFNPDTAQGVELLAYLQNNNNHSADGSDGSTGNTSMSTASYPLTFAVAQALRSFTPFNSAASVLKPGSAADWLSPGGLLARSSLWYSIRFSYVSAV